MKMSTMFRRPRRLSLSLLVRLLLPLLLCLGAESATAGVTVCIGTCGCTASTTNLSFPDYNPLAFGNTTTTGTIKVTCNATIALTVSVSLALSTGGGSTFAGRRMASGTNYLSYNLYTDNTYATIWGDGTSSTGTMSGYIVLQLLGAVSGTWTVYGQIPGRQLTVPPGTYTDSVTVSVTYE